MVVHLNWIQEVRRKLVELQKWTALVEENGDRMIINSVLHKVGRNRIVAKGKSVYRRPELFFCSFPKEM